MKEHSIMFATLIIVFAPPVQNRVSRKQYQENSSHMIKIEFLIYYNELFANMRVQSDVF
jgi:hypothetical protein